MYNISVFVRKLYKSDKDENTQKGIVKHQYKQTLKFTFLKMFTNTIFSSEAQTYGQN